MQELLKKVHKLQEYAVSNGISFSTEYEASTKYQTAIIKTSIEFLATVSDITDRRLFLMTFNQGDADLTMRWKLEALKKTLDQAIESKEMFDSMTSFESDGKE